MAKTNWIYQLIINKIAAPIALRRFHVHGEKTRLPEGPQLILSNHVTNSDFLFIEGLMNCSSPHIVAADNAVRNPIGRWILVHLGKCILHVKGAQSVATVKAMLRALQAGENVLLFPEGNTSFDGRTAQLNSAIGKLAKRCGASLMLVRISGGYLTKPRWAVSRRPGQMSLSFTPVPAQTLQRMTPDEITALINQALYVDAYADQARHPIPYPSDALCRGLERAVYHCPACGSYGTLYGSKNQLRCTCGYTAEMDAFGFLSDSRNGCFTMTQLLDAQKKALSQSLTQPASTPLWTDRVTLTQVNSKAPKHSAKPGTCRMTAYPDRILLETENAAGEEILYTQMKGAEIFKANTLTLFIRREKLDAAYEIHGGFSFNALKYRDLFELTHI